MTEKEKMINGEFYIPWDPELEKARKNCKKKIYKYNNSRPGSENRRKKILRSLINIENESYLCIEPPFRCDYGFNITLKGSFYSNFNCTILDTAPVTIGKDVMFGPNVSLFSVNHPLDPDERLTGKEIGKPINIGDKCWIGGNVTILPGVTIGEGTTIGAGSVVNKDIPPGVFAAGVPCKVLTGKITE